MKEVSKIIGANIKKQRKELGLSMKQLSYELNNTKSTVADAEAGRTNMNIITLLRYAKALNCKLSDLLDGVEEE